MKKHTFTLQLISVIALLAAGIGFMPLPNGSLFNRLLTRQTDAALTTATSPIEREEAIFSLIKDNMTIATSGRGFGSHECAEACVDTVFAKLTENDIPLLINMLGRYKVDLPRKDMQAVFTARQLLIKFGDKAKPKVKEKYVSAAEDPSGLLSNTLSYLESADEMKADTEARHTLHEAIRHAPIAPTPKGPVMATSSARFSSALSFTQEQSLNDAWSYGTAAGAPAWLDHKTHMLWSVLQQGEFSYDDKNLNIAKKQCAALSPEGAWALPTAAEFDLAKVNGIISVDNNAKHRWLTYIDMQGGFDMVAGRGWIPTAQESAFHIRCIARTEAAPTNGYGQNDISNDITFQAMQ